VAPLLAREDGRTGLSGDDYRILPVSGHRSRIPRCWASL